MVDKAAAAQHKANGNASFKAAKYEEAVEHFTKAIKEDPSDHVFYSNRSGAYVSLKNGELALADATQCVALKPEWAKGHGRVGAAHWELGNLAEALEAYEKGLEIDPSNAGFKDSSANLKREINRPPPGAGGAGGLFGGPEAITRLLTNPETAEFMKDPAFMQKLQTMGQDPMKLIQEAQNDPRLMKAIQVMSGVNMSGPPDEPAPPKEKKPEPKPEPEPEVELTEEEKSQKELEAAAAEDKKLGTAAYKKKDFDTALKHYQAGFEKVPTDITFLSNQGSVYLEKKEYDECIAICQKAVDVGRETRTDFKKIAKVMGRIGTAHDRKGDVSEAIVWYNKSLTEHRTADVLAKKQAAEKTLKENAKNEYRDDAKALEEREKGNECFKAGQFAEAVKHYTESISRNPDDVKPLSNRAACYQKLFALPQAVEDCEKVIKMDPKFVKGYTRKGDALFGMRRHEEARQTYNEALAIEPTNQNAKDGLYRCNEAIRKKEANMTPEERRERAMKDPEIQNILKDPVMNAVLEQMQKDPGAVQEHMRNPDIAAKINKLVQAGVIGMR